jgi:hypothetical protein
MEFLGRFQVVGAVFIHLRWLSQRKVVFDET